MNPIEEGLTAALNMERGFHAKTKADKHWEAQQKSSNARAMAKVEQRFYEVLHQHQPVAGLGLDRAAVEKLLRYVLFDIKVEL